jgi:hypothetical protein
MRKLGRNSRKQIEIYISPFSNKNSGTSKSAAVENKAENPILGAA